MINPSRTDQHRKQFQAVRKAKDWAECPMMVKRSIKEAAGYRALTEMQWWSLGQYISPDLLHECKKLVGVIK